MVPQKGVGGLDFRHRHRRPGMGAFFQRLDQSPRVLFMFLGGHGDERRFARAVGRRPNPSGPDGPGKPRGKMK
jgi:hypothetical protein